MALIIRSADVPRLIADGELTPDHAFWAYNGADCAVTMGVHKRLAPMVDATSNQPGSAQAAIAYNFVRAMQGPALDMMLRGIAVNGLERQRATEHYEALRAECQRRLDLLANAVWGPEEYEEVTRTKEWHIPLGKRGQPLTPRERTVTTRTARTRPRGLNANSSPQLLAFFNIALAMPVQNEVRKSALGNTRSPTANGKALRHWRTITRKGAGISPRDPAFSFAPLARPFVDLILEIRNADKMLGVLRTGLSPDGRMRCSYNVAGTENTRWSSSENAFGHGTNMQNITPAMRRMFCADDGWRLISNDLEQAEARLVAGLVWSVTGDDTYWRACESSDLHTRVCILSWPELEWTDNAKSNREIADRPYPGLPRFSYRDVAKRVGHGTNYRGSAFGIAAAVGIPDSVVSAFQARYFRAFPAIRRWHQWIITQIQTVQYLDNPFGWRRYFFGRPDDDSTIREAIACLPQATIGQLLNLALYRTWRRTLLPRSDPDHLPIQLLLQNHDAFAFQIPNHLDPAPILATVKSILEIPIALHHADETRTMTIPAEFVTGWNWAYADDTSKPAAKWAYPDGNPDGLTKWRGADLRARQQPAKTRLSSWLDRRVS